MSIVNVYLSQIIFFKGSSVHKLLFYSHNNKKYCSPLIVRKTRNEGSHYNKKEKKLSKKTEQILMNTELFFPWMKRN